MHPREASLTLQKTAKDAARITFGYMCRATVGGAVPAAARLLTCVLPHHIDAGCTAPTVLPVCFGLWVETVLSLQACSAAELHSCPE